MAAALAPVVLVAGCGTNDFYAQVVDDPPPGGSTAACSGECVPNAPLGWSQPVLLWAGAIEDAPPCPKEAPTLGYEGYAGLGATPLACPPCACEAPTGVGCVVPEGWRSSSAPCGQAGAMLIFDAPPGWDGACTAEHAIPAGAMCNGSPCVRSLTIHPPTPVGGSCAPKMDGPVPAKDQAFTTFARACLGNAYPPCSSPGDTCVPAAPEEFATCIYQKGDVACPDPWSVKHVFYEELIDDRGCSDCSCGPPEGSVCVASVSVYADGSCSNLLLSTSLGSAEPAACHDLMSGVALGSKVAEVDSVEPGECPPLGGEPIGDVSPGEPATFCCLP